MTLATGLLMLGDSGAPRGIVASRQGTLAPDEGPGILAGIFGRPRTASYSGDGAGDLSHDPIRPRQAPLDAQRWQSIVIHHSGAPAGDAESIERQHLSYGYASLGYHFVVGNGHGLGDGAVFVGPRWNQQQAGAHANGPKAEWLNDHAIGICLVGNGDRRPFTDRQIRELVALVRRLQETFDIPATAIHLHSDVAAVSSPGRLFPAAAFESQIRH